jgi:pimeloyl-ACP methyl ester carboxylesterase
MAYENPKPRAIEIPVDRGLMSADLTVPDECQGIVVFAHGSGSSRRSPRNRFVANKLVAASLATLLADLLTPEEAAVDERTAHIRFDISLLAQRVVTVLDWIAGQDELRGLPAGLFGASTGAAAALVATAERPSQVSAVVSRGGRPDLAESSLRSVRAPTLLIVGGNDADVLELNRFALAKLTCEARLEVIPLATHLFEEPGTLEQVTRLAQEWFRSHFVITSTR